MVGWGQGYGARLSAAAVREGAVGGHQEGTGHGSACRDAGGQGEGPLHGGYTLKHRSQPRSHVHGLFCDSRDGDALGAHHGHLGLRLVQ